MASYKAGYGVGNAISGHDLEVIFFSFYFHLVKGGIALKQMVFQMAALNEKQHWLCDIMTRLRFVRYLELDGKGIPIGWVDESPITEKPINVWWRVKSLKVFYMVWRLIWGTLCWDDVAERHMNELKQLGWVKETRIE